MNIEPNTTKYFAYVRKSTEGEERQALSIQSQKDKVREQFHNLDIVDVLVEKRSAFKPNNRTVFQDMIERIEKKEATGIIAWHPDRLSRNEIDASTITYLVRTGVIEDLKFGSYNFDNSPEGIMMLQLALSQSQYFSSKLGKDVKRGLDKKMQMGWKPGVAPEGYMNNIQVEKGLRTIIIDPERFPILRKAFDLMLTGSRTAQEVLNTLNDEWGYTTRRKKKTGGGPLARTVWYKMLKNPFYAGVIVYGGQEVPGAHKPLITMDEYNRIQELLGVRGCKRKPKQKNFTFSGMFTCGNCGSAITAEHKSKYIRSTKEVRGYDYYHCTHKRKDMVCQERSVEETEIHKHIIQMLKKLELEPRFLAWAVEYIDSQKGADKKKVEQVQKSILDKRKEIETNISGLTMMRAKGLLDDEEYLKEKNKLKTELDNLQDSDKQEIQQERVRKLTKETFEFCVHGLKDFIEGDKNTKRETLADLGSNRTIQDKKVLISVHKWLLPLYEHAESLNAQLARLEPTKEGYIDRKSDAFASLNLSLRRRRDSNPRYSFEYTTFREWYLKPTQTLLHRVYSSIYTVYNQG